MAKGNDGNLLQHWVEADLSWRLNRRRCGSPLHIVLTHGMAPYEFFQSRRKPGKKEPPSGSKKIDGWLTAARKPNLPPTPPSVLFAYRDCGASPSRYPNSGEVLATLLGRGNLQGVICEICPSKLDQLRYAWEGRQVEVLEGSWRTHLGRLSYPDSGDCPWLFSMDPMTFVPTGEDQDDASLRPGDFQRLTPVLNSYLSSGQPGAITIFCFSLVTQRAVVNGMGGQASYEPFQSAIVKLANKLRCYHAFCEVSASNPHVGGLLSADADLIRQVKLSWEQHYREVP